MIQPLFAPPAQPAKATSLTIFSEGHWTLVQTPPMRRLDDREPCGGEGKIDFAF